MMNRANANLAPADIEAIERATLAAVAPQIVQSLDDEAWLLPMDSGTVGRAKSAVPLRHAAPRAPAGLLLERIEARYAAQGHPACLRVADAPCFHALRDALARRSYQDRRPVVVTQIGSTRDMRAASQAAPADVDDAPDAAWAALFLGPGFDPVDGASRLQALGRGFERVFLQVEQVNVPALALYRRAGFQAAWHYRYWQGSAPA